MWRKCKKMKKAIFGKATKFLSLILALILCLSIGTLFACNDDDDDTASQAGDLATVWSALSTEKFMQKYSETSEIAKKDEIGKTEAELNVAGIKGETEASQLMITAKQFVKGFDLEPADLTMTKADGTTVTMAKENFDVYAERYVYIVPYVNNKLFIPVDYPADLGYYPDALIPIDRFQLKREDRIQAGNNQGIWVDFKIPADAEAGVYNGTFKLTMGEENLQMDIPVSVTVYDIVMPEEVHSRSLFKIWYDQIPYGEGENYLGTETDILYYNYLLEKKLCCDHVPGSMMQNLDQYIETMVELVQDPRVTCWTLTYTSMDIAVFKYNCFVEEAPSTNFGSGDITIEEKREIALEQQEIMYDAMLNAFGKILDKTIEVRTRAEDPVADLNLFEDLLFYFEDEPGVMWRWARVKKFGEILTKAKRDFIASRQEDFTAHPDLEKSLRENVQDITPALDFDKICVSNKADGTPDYEKGDGTTLWCPQMFYLNPSNVRQYLEMRKSYGVEKVWWYLCCSSSPGPSYYVDSVDLNIRVQSWMQYQYDILGVLYWDTVHWKGTLNVDPYNNLGNTIRGSWGAGEGILLYPGAPYGINGPVSCIRLEQIRDGQEDYEYFYMLTDYIAETDLVDTYRTENGIDTSVSDVKVAKKIVGDIITVMQEGIYEGTFIVEDPDNGLFESNRITILEILELFAKDNPTAALQRISTILA